MRIPLSEPERSHLSGFMITFGLTIVAWACAHDLYLIGIEPRHFTEFHRPLLPLTNHTALAIQYATVATLGPGMVFGALSYATARVGSPPQLTLKTAWCSFLPFIVIIEAAALLAGEFARTRHAAGQSLPYPLPLYPDDTAGIAYSQSVNITAYLAAAMFGAIYQAALVILRRTAADKAV